MLLLAWLTAEAELRIEISQGSTRQPIAVVPFGWQGKPPTRPSAWRRGRGGSQRPAASTRWSARTCCSGRPPVPRSTSRLAHPDRRAGHRPPHQQGGDQFEISSGVRRPARQTAHGLPAGLAAADLRRNTPSASPTSSTKADGVRGISRPTSPTVVRGQGNSASYRLVIADADGENARSWSTAAAADVAGLSPDGEDRPCPSRTTVEIYVQDLRSRRASGFGLSGSQRRRAWSPDARRLAVAVPPGWHRRLPLDLGQVLKRAHRRPGDRHRTACRSTATRSISPDATGAPQVYGCRPMAAVPSA